MKKIFLLAFIVMLLASCRDKNISKNDKLYYDYSCRIVAYQDPTDWQNGKYRGVSREWLIYTHKTCAYTT